jgi:PAS domain S-box-containing protein
MAKILIIDDRPVNRQFLTTLLRYQHHDLREASDGVEGLRAARDQRSDLIISDVLMPTMDGYEFVRRLREDPQIGQTRVIFSTAHYLSRESKALANKCGVTSIIYKPCEPQTVLDIVAAALSDRASPVPAAAQQPGEFDREHLRLVTDKVAEGADQLRDVHGKLAALIELSADLAQERDPVQLLNRYCSVARGVVGAGWTMVVLLERNRKAVQYLGIVGIDVEDSPALRSALLETGIFKTLLKEGRTICLSDVTSISAELRLPDGLPRAASLLVAPLVMRGHVDGWICLADKLGFDAFSEEDEQLAPALAAQMAMAYANARLYSDTLKHSSKLEAEIVQRAGIERQLSDSRAQLAGIIGSAMDSIVTVDSDHRIVMFNGAAEKMFRCTAAEVIGQPLDRFIPPGFRSTHSQDIRKFGETDITIRTMAATRPVNGLRSDGEEFPLEASISQIEVGGQKLYTVIMRDITDRQLAQETAAKLASIVESSHDAIISKTLDGIITSWNLSAQKLYGYSAEEVLGRAIAILAPSELSDEIDTILERLMQGDRIEDFETERITKEGKRISVSLTISPIRGSSGAVGGWSTIARNITERNRLEEARRASELRYRRLFESAKDGILILNAETGQIVDANPYIMNALGYAYEELLGKELWEIGFFRDASEAKKAFAELQVSGYVRYEDLPLKTRGGLTIEVEVVANVYPVGDAKVIQCNIRDVTERKSGERALEETNRKLEATVGELSATTQQLWQASKLATMGELSASIAHELNNPLATVALRVENLLVHLADDDQQRRPLEIITQEVDRMATLVDNLLQFSRRSHRQITTVNVGEEISKSVDFVRYHLRTHKIEVVREFADRLPTIQADCQQLRQLFLNLLTNASDAMPQGGKLTVRATSNSARDAGVCIDFADSGEGITPENLEMIWEPFFTTKGEGKGTGLGLAICRRIVEEHGGTISIITQIGHGTTVSILLPATDSQEALTPVENVNLKPGSLHR